MSNSTATPGLSVVIPVYNVEPWLSQCLNSVMRQTFTAWEAIRGCFASFIKSGGMARRRKQSRLFQMMELRRLVKKEV